MSDGKPVSTEEAMKSTAPRPSTLEDFKKLYYQRLDMYCDVMSENGDLLNRLQSQSDALAKVKKADELLSSNMPEEVELGKTLITEALAEMEPKK